MRPLHHDLHPLRPERARVVLGLEYIDYIGRECAKVVAAEQLVELGKRTQIGAAKLFNRVGKVDQEITETSWPNP